MKYISKIPGAFNYELPKDRSSVTQLAQISPATVHTRLRQTESYLHLIYNEEGTQKPRVWIQSASPNILGSTASWTNLKYLWNALFALPRRDFRTALNWKGNTSQRVARTAGASDNMPPSWPMTIMSGYRFFPATFHSDVTLLFNAADSSIWICVCIIDLFRC